MFFHIDPGAFGGGGGGDDEDDPGTVVPVWSLSSFNRPSFCNFAISCANILDVGGACSSCSPLIWSRSAKNGNQTEPTPTAPNVIPTAQATIFDPDVRAADILLFVRLSLSLSCSS